MLDKDIRQVLLHSLNEEHSHDPQTRIIEEFGLCQGSAIVDLAVVNGSMHGIEIKSERDSLRRLPSQQEIYNKTLDYVTIVAHTKHIHKIEKLIPEWWGISVALSENGKVSLNEFRKPEKNKEVDPDYLVQLLWRDEALQILKDMGLQKGFSNKRRRLFWDRLTANVPLHDLGILVRNAIKQRHDWKSDQPR